MKKTIAKIMAAAMVLSAVPAVALPTLTAEAGDNDVTMSTVAVEENSAGHLEVAEDGYTGVNIGKGATVSFGTGSSVDGDANTDVYVAVNSSNESAASGVSKYLEDIMKVSVDKDGNLLLTVNTAVSDYEKVLANALYKGENTITLRIYSDQYGTTAGGGTGTSLAVSTISNYYEGTWVIGGEVNTTTHEVAVTDLEAKEGTLRDGDISIKLTSSVANEVEVLKGANGDLDGNDALRTQTLDLTTVTFGGITTPFKVVKIGAQALKKAHMKKFVAENVKTVGKGALRGAKQVKKVDISDSNKVRKIHSKAFYSCKNLKTVAIDGRKLNTVGSGAFSGVKKNCTIKIKAKKTKYNSDVKLIKKSGAKNVKFTRMAP